MASKTFRGWVDASGNHVIKRAVTATEGSIIFGQSGYGMDVKAWGATATTDYLLWDNSLSTLSVNRSIATTTGTNRLAVFDQTLTGAITTLSTTAFRAHTQMSANAITGGAYLYGGQHKFTLGGGTINHADSRVCASLVQLDLSTGTYTAGQLSALWIDAGTSSAMANNGGQFNMLRITNTTILVPNAVVYIYSEGSYLLDLGGPGGNADWFGAGSSGGATRKYKLKVKCPDGSDGYMSVYTD